MALRIMLQQTTVATVGPYFRAFLRRWPTLMHMATAPEEAVLDAWVGLVIGAASPRRPSPVPVQYRPTSSYPNFCLSPAKLDESRAAAGRRGLDF